MSGGNIKVVARFRPQNKIEKAAGGQPIVRFDGDTTCHVDVRWDPSPLGSPVRTR
jgi:kinesin family member 5